LKAFVLSGVVVPSGCFRAAAGLALSPQSAWEASVTWLTRYAVAGMCRPRRRPNCSSPVRTVPARARRRSRRWSHSSRPGNSPRCCAPCCRWPRPNRRNRITLHAGRARQAFPAWRVVAEEPDPLAEREDAAVGRREAGGAAWQARASPRLPPWIDRNAQAARPALPDYAFCT
jgi:hypothetical protein